MSHPSYFIPDVNQNQFNYLFISPGSSRVCHTAVLLNKRTANILNQVWTNVPNNYFFKTVKEATSYELTNVKLFIIHLH